jgi:predicted small secreted protein
MEGNEMKIFAKAFAFALLLAVSIVVFSGCQTAKGFGEDMENAGDSIQEKIEE